MVTMGPFENTNSKGSRIRHAPTAPGLGIELSEVLRRAHPYLAAQLHLEMSTTHAPP